MPFQGSIQDTANATLLFSLAASVLTLFMVGAPPSLLRTAAKTMAVALLGVLAYVEGGPFLLVAALAFSAAGDAFLSRDGDPAFLAGLASFLAAHLVFAVLFLSFGGGAEIFLSQPWRSGLVVLLAALAGGMAAFLMRRVEAKLRLPILAYVLAILLMGVAAFGVNSAWIVVGALSFAVSDAILATERFVASADSQNRLAMRHAVWVFYYAAQLAFTLGFLLG